MRNRWETRQAEREKVKEINFLYFFPLIFSLKLKFGGAGLQRLPEIREIENVELLEAIAEAIKTVSTLDELRQIYRTEQ